MSLATADCASITGNPETKCQSAITGLCMNQLFVVKKTELPESRSLIVGAWSARRTLSRNRLLGTLGWLGI
jgi:hypothetical protein